VNPRVSADGRLIAWLINRSPKTFTSFVFEGRTIKGPSDATTRGQVFPGPDGQTIFTPGLLFTQEAKAIGNPPGRNTNIAGFVPAAHGRFYLAIEHQPGPNQRVDLSAKVHVQGLDQAIANLTPITGLEGLMERSGQIEPLDQHLFLHPDAKRLIILPKTRDKLLLFRWDVEEILERSGTDYLLVFSEAPTSFEPGKTVSYPIAVRSKLGGVKYKLEAGPPGMKVSPEGLLHWDVPRDFKAPQTSVILTISDLSGQEVFHTFIMKKAGAVAAK
jgi:hypothetical protein